MEFPVDWIIAFALGLCAYEPLKYIVRFWIDLFSVESW